MTISVWVFPETDISDVSLELIAAIKQGYLTVKAAGVWAGDVETPSVETPSEGTKFLGLIWITNTSAVLIPAHGGITLMANTNNFKAFALDPNANVMSQEGWEALPALLAGFSSGKASSAQVNKAIRQATTIAALVGQFIANSGVDALDNGDVSGLVTKFTSALKTNLTLGTASTKDIGTGTNQVPDMNSFTSANNWFKLPSGYIVQFFSASFDTSGSYINFPTPLPQE